MATQNVILTALPNGIHRSGALKVTVFVSPRLSTDGPPSLPLSAFGAFADWPKALDRLRTDGRLLVEVEGTGPVPTDPDPDSAPADPAVWALLFDPAKVGVVTGAFKDLSTRRVLTYPTADVASQILGLYGDIATTSPTSFPPATTGRLALLGRSLGAVADNPGEFYRSLDGLIAQGAPQGTKGRFLNRGALNPPQAAQLAFVQAQRFYDRPGTRDPAGPDLAPDPPKPPEIDFHGYCASLGDYPLLLRRLGLAIDVLAKRPPALGQTGRIRVRVDGAPADLAFTAVEEARPWTRFQRSDPRFIALPRERESDLVDGSLRLENAKLFGVHQIDVDGSALKTVHFAANLRRLQAHLGSASMTADEASLPALRTGGFVITRDDRARQLAAQVDAQAAHEANHTAHTPADLYAEDVTRGFRPDVLDTTGTTWRTLSARTGSYTVGTAAGPKPVAVPPDEGFVKGASTTSVPTEHDADLYLHESVFGWEGWSLAAHRPGQTIVDNAGHDVGTVDEKPPDDFPLVTSFAPTPGSLPRLRFGRTYRFRARAVDLAGNSVPEADLVAQHRSEPVLFQRFDPVPSPAVVPRRAFSEGESLLRMVIRSTLGVAADPYAALPRITGLVGHTDAGTAYRALNERHLAAPKSPVQLAEWHGMLDAAFGLHASQADLDGQFAIASREAGSYIEPGAGAAVINPNPGAVPTDLTTLGKGDPLKPGEYVVHDVDDLPLPYLPDPMSAGASFSSLPGDAASRTQAWPGGAWPDARTIRIRIADGGLTTGAQKPPSWDAGQRLLTVFLRQAELVTVRLSSFPADVNPQVTLGVMGIWNLLPAAAQAAQAADAKAGRAWMLTPYAELTLVHAVEKPLTAPVVSVDNAGVQRGAGETFAVLAGTIGNHAKSTGRLDVDATWSEPVDDLAKDAPNDAANLGEIPGAAHVVDFLLERSEDACHTGRDDAPAAGATPATHRVRHEFRDTKHRTVTYQATATTRYREYFPTAITDDPALITNAGPPTVLSVPSSRRPDPPDVLYVVPTFRWADDNFRGILAGLTPDALQPKVASAVTGLKNSAALFAAGVRDTAVALQGIRLPTVTRRIRTAGLRVYLGRPWYSSGAEELLAVVVPDQPYVVWPIDLAKGLAVEAAARALADDTAGRLLAAGTLKAVGGAKLSPSEQLVGGLQKLTDPAAGDRLNAEAFQASQLAAALGGIVLKSGDPEQFVTRWGSDPVWGSDPPDSGPWIHQFPLRSRVGTGLSLAEAPGNSVAAIGHTPQFDPARGLWYCDIDIDAGTSYFPFVRLGLARYQPSSIPGVHLSRVVVPEWAQLMPERTASMTRPSGAAARVTLRGPAGFTDVASMVLGGAAAAGQQGMDLSRFAVAQVERLPAGATSDLSWVAAGPEVRLGLSIATAYSDIAFSGTVEVPTAASGEQMRLTIREYEILQTDASQAQDVVKHDTFTVVPLQPAEVGPPVGLVPHPDDKPVRFRLAYAGHLAL